MVRKLMVIMPMQIQKEKVENKAPRQLLPDTSMVKVPQLLLQPEQPIQEMCKCLCRFKRKKWKARRHDHCCYWYCYGWSDYYRKRAICLWEFKRKKWKARRHDHCCYWYCYG